MISCEEPWSEDVEHLVKLAAGAVAAGGCTVLIFRVFPVVGAATVSPEIRGLVGSIIILCGGVAYYLAGEVLEELNCAVEDDH